MKMTLVPDIAPRAMSGTPRVQRRPVDDLFCFECVAVQFDNSTIIEPIKMVKSAGFLV